MPLATWGLGNSGPEQPVGCGHDCTRLRRAVRKGELMRIRPVRAAIGAALLACAAGAASGQSLTTIRVATGVTRPAFMTAPPGDTSRLFIVEQRGSGGVATRADIRILTLPDHTL